MPAPDSANTPSPTLTHWVQYLGMRAVAAFMQSFDVAQNLHTAGVVGSFYFHISKRHRMRALRNLELSFPDWPADRIAHVAEQSIQHMLRLVMVDAMVMPRLVTPTMWTQYVRLGNLTSAMDRLIRHEPIIFVTPHFGNWELLGYALAVIGYPLHAIARPIDNPLVNDWLMGVREARGLRIITKWGATPVLQNLLTSRERLGFIADQNAGDQGLFVPFFGRLASSYKSIALLAMRYRVPIIAGAALRLPGSGFAYELSSSDALLPEEWEGRPDPLFYITARYARAMETQIRTAPEQYLWVHRRWKSRPRHERLGKPMPARLIARLESLPWMTQAELDRIVNQSNETAKHGATDGLR